MRNLLGQFYFVVVEFGQAIFVLLYTYIRYVYLYILNNYLGSFGTPKISSFWLNHISLLSWNNMFFWNDFEFCD